LLLRGQTRFAWLDPSEPSRHSFSSAGATTPLLLVRIYPDDIHVDGHDPLLTDAEQRWQEEFRRRVDAGRDLIHFVDAWAELIARVGPRRAAWIAHTSRGPRGAPAADRLGRPPRAALQPDRWFAIARTMAGTYTGRSRIVGERLLVAPDATAIGSTTTAVAGEALAWLTDFNTALDVGMALRIQFPVGPPPQVERLLVVGACTSLDPGRSATAVAGLLDAHHYTHGVSLLPPGAPTNSTPEQRAAVARAPSAREVWDVEGDMFPLVSPPRTLVDTPGCDGQLAAQLLGIAQATFAHVAGADGLTALAGRELRFLLSRAALPHVRRLLGTNVAETDWNFAEAVFVGGPGALGPLPTLRIGNQPYGILPVGLWSGADQDIAASPERGRLLALLGRLRSEIFEPAASRVARVGQVGSDPAVTLLDILQTDGVARALRLRPALAPDVSNALTFDRRTARVLAGIRSEVEDLLARLGAANPHPPLVDLTHLDAGAPVRRTLVEADGATGVERFLEYLRIASLSVPLGLFSLYDLAIGNYSQVGGRPTPFLFALARLALLTAADEAARSMLSGIVDPAWEAAWDADTSDAAGSATPLYSLADKLVYRWPDPSGTGVHVWLTSNTPPVEANPFIAVRSAIRSLAAPYPVTPGARTHDPRIVDAVLRAELGMLTHRLDAWYTALATYRIWAARGSRATGLAIGGFGVLEGIAPAPLSVVPPSITLPASVRGPVFADANNAGFVHTPSATHAATAAVLRSAHLAHHALATDPRRREAFAIQLSSRRVRSALDIVDGLRDGQPLGALLGYRIERSLLAANPRAIAIARHAAPLVAKQAAHIDAAGRSRRRH
jgi:hypothetical protein